MTEEVRSTAKPKIIVFAVAAALIVFALVAAGQSNKPQAVGDTFSQTFAPGDPCTSASIALAVPADADPADVAQKLFTALGKIEGINTAKYNVKTATLDTGFCDSVTSEANVRQALAPTGLVVAQEPGTAPEAGAEPEAGTAP